LEESGPVLWEVVTQQFTWKEQLGALSFERTGSIFGLLKMNKTKKFKTVTKTCRFLLQTVLLTLKLDGLKPPLQNPEPIPSISCPHSLFPQESS
jgi:hypothetical protein